MLIGTLDIMNGIQNLICQRFRLTWLTEEQEEEDLLEEEEPTVDIDENRFSKWYLL